MKKETFRGSIALTGLVHETRQVNGKKGIFIPIDDNPSIFFQMKEDGTKIINLDIEVKPTPDSKYGNSHFVKAFVGKANREKFNISNERLKDYTPILGNLKRFEYDSNENGGQKQQYQSAPSGEDMPAELDGAW